LHLAYGGESEVVRESTRMFLHYIAGLTILVTGAIHLLANNLPEFSLMLHTSNLYPINLAIFLAALLYHALNGIRVILMELIPTPCSGTVITWILIIVGVIAYAYGLQVIIRLFGWMM